MGSSVSSFYFPFQKYIYIFLFLSDLIPNAELKLITLRARVVCSPDGGSQMPLSYYLPCKSLIEWIVWLIESFWAENHFPLKFWVHCFVFLFTLWLMRSLLPVCFCILCVSYCCSDVLLGQELVFHHAEHLWVLSVWGLRNFTLLQLLVLFLWKCLSLVVLVLFSRNKTLSSLLEFVN